MSAFHSNGLQLGALRDANLKRLPRFKSNAGTPAHSQSDGSDWSLGDWVCAVTGELGEAANIVKKITRGDFTLEQGRKDLGDELADVLIYLDILAYRAGIDLSAATINKWNRTSVKVGANLVLDAQDWHYIDHSQEDA